ncbi:MAG: hypothetical protein AB2A00_23450 [Myxococcota bacterium]
MMCLPVLLVLAAQAEPARVVVLPPRLAADARTEVRSAAPGVERSLAESLAKHSGFHVVSRLEIAAMLGSAAREQLMGCDAESCVAEVADALNADYVVTSQLGLAQGVWSFQAALVQRKTASALRRAGVKSRALDGLISSVDAVARQLASGSRVAADAEDLQRRLGTNDAGVRELRSRLAETPDADLTAVWTDVVVERNRESDRVALLESGLLTAAAGTSILAGALFGTLYGIHVATTFRFGDPATVGSTETTSAAPPDGPYLFPLPLVILMLVLPVPIYTLSALLVAAAGGVALWDALDRGRVRVARNGCCRDEERVQAAQRPGVGRRVAPYLTGTAGACALLSPMTVMSCGVASALGFMPLLFLGTQFVGPTVALPPQEFRQAYDVTNLIVIINWVTTSLSCGGVLLGSSLGLMLTEKSELLDDDVAR